MAAKNPVESRVVIAASLAFVCACGARSELETMGPEAGTSSAPLQCKNGMKDGTETAVDCGGLEWWGNCPARCMMGQACITDCDCDAATSCRVDPMDGMKRCALGAKGMACKLICSD